MSELAARAYEAEQEHVDTALEVRDEMGVRDLLLRLARLDQEADRVRKLRIEIVDRYDQRLDGIDREREAIRQSVENFLVHVNGGRKVSIPDAGTAYLTTRNKGGKATVTDGDALRAWLEQDERDLIEFKPPAYDPKATLDRAHDVLFYTTPDGKLVHRETGEVIEIPGVQALPESKALALRAA